jgi:hypothetical protein
VFASGHLSLPINSDVQRTIDISKAIVRVTIDIKVNGVENEYKIAFLDQYAKQLSYLHIENKNTSLDISSPVT